MRTEEERQGMIEDIMGNEMEAGEFVDQLDALVEENGRLERELKAAREEIEQLKEEVEDAVLESKEERDY